MEIEQKRRRKLLDEGCEKLNLSRSLPNLNTRYTGHLIVDNEYKILFNFIPKVSCKTWKSVFGELRRTHSNRGKSLLSAYSEEEQQYRLANYRKAVFVREPITRLLSMYLSKFCNFRNLQRIWERMYGRKIVAQYRNGFTPYSPKNNDTGPLSFLNITLSEFIQFLTDREGQINLGYITDHFLPLNIVSSPCAIHYDFIGHYENLTTEAPYMLKFFGANHAVQYPPVHASSAVNRLVNEYKKVPLDLMKRLRKYYRNDYELFGYSFDDTLKSIVETFFSEDDE
ncbi:carbohydrate sulfotransferase 14-like [Amphiura filiformis]|uniref:carbohydrate sulfotransferase 14-like n=1 Tax=Amphiura filiformis TaxID=82378 RepID=UPI003B219ED2